MMIINNTAAQNTFDFNGHQLRTIEIDGEPWFHATDICNCLGLGLEKGTNNHTRRLNADETRIVTPSQARGLRGRGATYVTEGGLYKLIMRSDKQTAEPFQTWVASVIKSIRKTGGYLLNEVARETAHADKLDAMPMMEKLFEQITAMMAEQTKSNPAMLQLVEHLSGQSSASIGAANPGAFN